MAKWVVFVQNIQGTIKPDVELYSPLPLVLDSQSGPRRQGLLPLEVSFFLFFFSTEKDFMTLNVLSSCFYLLSIRITGIP